MDNTITYSTIVKPSAGKAKPVAMELTVPAAKHPPVTGGMVAVPNSMPVAIRSETADRDLSRR